MRGELWFPNVNDTASDSALIIKYNTSTQNLGFGLKSLFVTGSTGSEHKWEIKFACVASK